MPVAVPLVACVVKLTPRIVCLLASPVSRPGAFTIASSLLHHALHSSCNLLVTALSTRCNPTCQLLCFVPHWHPFVAQSQTSLVVLPCNVAAMHDLQLKRPASMSCVYIWSMWSNDHPSCKCAGAVGPHGLELPGPRKSLGVQFWQRGNASLVYKMIPYNVPVPCSATQVFTTVHDNTDTVWAEAPSHVWCWWYLCAVELWFIKLLLGYIN
jgi:hypothetical protein